jgi:hypothetical protein
MLIAASWPSNNEAAVTKRSGAFLLLPEAWGTLLAAVLINSGSPINSQRKTLPIQQDFLENQLVLLLQKF